MDIKQTLEFAHWLDSLKDKRAQLRIDIRIRRLADGNPGEHRDLKGGVSELKIREGKAYRVYYTERGGELVILLCGGDKSSKTKQQADIAKAQRLAANLGETDDY
ncbi:type II toxin-antitoxin system RelE/ParE family toxin [Salinisphaera sp. LB1]|uniref:type II toxin-antitoxin system RelE/ParE family toxin n=1 Tax=Salinisphaera sp. LB1 TaxID=2183911 RepID=UPI000D7073B7|nr:type II toxin-antitoxin system RelE/ParE family toxin [Salinisphaera sp. LB1]AWN16333.1 putative toxin [Salinisphaera sp. LB1]